MLRREWLALAGLAVLGGFATPVRGVQTESFNSAASAAANGWTAVGNGVDGQTVGWIGTNEAGGAAGEAQYDVSRGGQTMYADTSLGLTINGNGGFQMSGKLNLTGVVGGDTGIPPILGFFSSPTEYLGIMFRAEGGVNWGIRFEKTMGGIIFGAGGGPDYRLTPDTAYPFTLSYNPNEGPFGTVRAQVIGAGPEIVHALPEAHRVGHLNMVAFDKAGFVKRSNAAANESLQIRADDLTYTGVIPEPSSIVAASFCAIAIGFRRLRMRAV